MGWVLFFAAFMIGAISQAIATLIFIRTKLGRSMELAYISKTYGIEFRKMPNPPDEGIDQLVYKPQGEPAIVSKNAMGRRRVR